jgi:glycosyltransferase involved in cell wall biosynthesis
MQPITVYAIVYNEEKRIGPWVDQMSRWADDLIVFDKGSKDSTVEIAKSLGARVIPIPFTQGGHEDYHDLMSHIKTDWFVWSTPSQCFTPKLVQYFRYAVDNDDGKLGCIFAINKTYSFGIHNPQLLNCKHWVAKLHNLKRIRIHNRIHSNFENLFDSKFIHDEDAHIVHLAQQSYQNFISYSVDYTSAEVNLLQTHDDLLKAAKEAIHRASLNEFELMSPGPHDLRHVLASKIAPYMKALACLDKIMEPKTAENYAQIRDSFSTIWNTVPGLKASPPMKNV